MTDPTFKPIPDPADPMLAPCGIDCSACTIYRAMTDDNAAQFMVDWFHREGWLPSAEGIAELRARGPHCDGCKGDRSIQWSGDCWIRTCCIDDKHLDSCSDCDTFPCDRLSEWSKGDLRYTEALSRLKTMRER